MFAFLLVLILFFGIIITKGTKCESENSRKKRIYQQKLDWKKYGTFLDYYGEMID